VITVKRVETEYKKNLERAIKDMATTVAKVGWIEKNQYPNREQKRILTVLRHIYAYHYLKLSYSPPNVAYVAYIQEMGSPSKKIPARPFLRPTISEQKNKWNEIAKKYSKLIIKGDSTAKDMFEVIGQTARFDIQKKIKSIWSPPLSKRTIQARKNRSSTGEATNKPLIDTSLMWSTITNSVENE